MTSINKHKGSDFDDYLLEAMRDMLIGKVVSAFGKNPLTIITATSTNYGAYIVNGHYVLTKAKALRLCDQPHRD